MCIRVAGFSTLAVRQLERRGFAFCLHPVVAPERVRFVESIDQLRELFRMQKALNERVGVKTDGMTAEEKTKWIQG